MPLLVAAQNSNCDIVKKCILEIIRSPNVCINCLKLCKERKRIQIQNENPGC